MNNEGLRLPDEEIQTIFKIKYFNTYMGDEELDYAHTLIDAHTSHLLSKVSKPEKLEDEILFRYCIMHCGLEVYEKSCKNDRKCDNAVFYAKEISDLFQLYTLQAVERAWQEGFGEGIRKTMDAADSTFGAQLKQARKEEQERILDMLTSRGLCADRKQWDFTTGKICEKKISCVECWQALQKEGVK